MTPPASDDPRHPVPGNDVILRSVYAEQGGVRGIFSTKVTDYAASRPGYPSALYDALRDAGALPSVPSIVADVGAGTGLFSEGLLLRGHHVFAVEPNNPMRAAADDRLGGYQGYRSIEAGAEATTLDPASVDLVTAAQAFHWFDVEATRSECLRILRPQGMVALIWNDRVLSDPLQVSIDEIFAEFGGPARTALVVRESRQNVPRFFAGAPMTAIDVHNEQTLDRAGLHGLIFSRSYMPPRDSEPGARAAQRIDEVFDAHATAETVLMRYRTTATLARPASQ
jgi:SAM-dependent methyltransferase